MDKQDQIQQLLRALPSVDRLLEHPKVRALQGELARGLLVRAVRRALDQARSLLRGGGGASGADIDALLERLLDLELAAATRHRLRPVINATGILLHTGLGRAPLAESVARHVYEAAHNYVCLEIDLDSGRRGKRTALVRDLLCELTGAEAATVVNNNAAATVIVLAALAANREVVVSRGELIEIGGSFRLPEIMAVSGAVLREVGTTNKTRLADYERAIGERTAALMKVHTSNYRVVGFSEAVPIEELVRLGRRYGLPVIDDIGSGALVDLAAIGLAGEPVAGRSVRAGADVVLFSGDKLLGGPQAGIIVGRAAVIEQIERHPLARAFRVDKLTLAALEATLRLYLDPDTAWQQVPVLAMAAAPEAVVRARAERLRTQLAELPGVNELLMRPDQAYVGGGSLPMQAIKTWVVGVRSTGLSEQELARRLRTGDPAVVPRVQDGLVLFDARTVRDDQVASVVRAVAAALASDG